MNSPEIKALIEHAVARAVLTESDGRQRVYEHPWKSKEEIYDFIPELKNQMREVGIRHTKPWLWAAATSTGVAQTPCGQDSGLELRFSYSAKPD